MQKFTTIKPLNQNNMGKTREKLLNANRYCHIYVDDDGITNYHDTETNETYRVISDTGALGFYLEYFKDGVLKARNSFEFKELKILANLTGSNYLLNNLIGGELKSE